MTAYPHRLGARVVRLSIMALLAPALLFPAGPYRALAQKPTPAPGPRLFLPFIGGGAVAAAPTPDPVPTPDLRFVPDAVALAPGDVVRVTVTVSPAADLRGATFELPGVQDGVTSAFDAAADGSSGILTIAASAASAAAERALTVQGQSGVDSSKAWTGALRVTTTAAVTAQTLFVNPSSGKDSNDGSQSKPFKTLKKGLSVAKSGDTVKLLPGVYGGLSFGSGDQFPLQVPNGVTVAGTLATDGTKQSSLAAPGGTADDLALTFAGDATVKDLEVGGFGTAIQATSGTQSFRNLNLILNDRSIRLRGTARTTLEDANVFLTNVQEVVQADQQPQFTLKNSKLDSTGGCETSFPLLDFRDTSKVTLLNVTATNFPGMALDMHDTVQAKVSFSKLERITSAGCSSNGFGTISSNSQATLLLDATRVATNGGQAATIIAWQSTSPLTLTGSTLNGNPTTGEQKGTGIDMRADAKLTVDDSRFFTFVTSIDASLVHTSLVSISTSGMFGDVGIIAPRLKLRTTEMQCRVCVTITGFGVDLGTSAEPGGNTIKAQVFSGNSFAAGVATSNNLPNLTVKAAGNTWQPNVQGADIQGRYAPGTQVNSTSPNAHGLNFNLTPDTKIQL